MQISAVRLDRISVFVTNRHWPNAGPCNTTSFSSSRTTRPGCGLRGSQRRVGLSTSIDGPERSVVDCRIKCVSTVGVAARSVMNFHWVCGESHLDPPVALLKYEHTSCEKQSWVLLASSVSTVLLTQLSEVGLHTRHFLPPCLSNPLRIGHCTNNCSSQIWSCQWRKEELTRTR